MGEEGTDMDLGGLGLSVKHIALLLGLAFVITLAIVVGKQMSTEAMAVVIGVVCGVVASIPTSVLLLVVLSRRDRRRDEEAERQAVRGAYPPVVVIQGGAPQGLPMGPQAGYWPAPSQGRLEARQYHVVGSDEADLWPTPT